MAFRATFRRCAADIQNLSPSATSELAKELLPPLQLYRRLLRVHRKVLPVEMRLMGDEYVKVSSPGVCLSVGSRRTLTL